MREQESEELIEQLGMWKIKKLSEYMIGWEPQCHLQLVFVKNSG